MIRALTLGALAFAVAACTTTDPYSGERVPNRTGTGAIAGAVGGAAIGTLAGGNDRRNAIIGAGIGALAGAAVGNYMDRQEAALREQLRNSGVGVTRTAEDEILLNLPSDITFGFNQDTVQSQFLPTIQQVAGTLGQYPSTTVDIIGHADSVGTDEYNQNLSERRAMNVASVLVANGVQRPRVAAYGYGETAPIADNGTPDGRARNRRVEIRLKALQS
ncbi:MAG: OmpA family protein [Alphaproteobacteria bacterium]|nr:OmpA family protein [Alphaproteobacteria bacterium]